MVPSVPSLVPEELPYLRVPRIDRAEDVRHLPLKLVPQRPRDQRLGGLCRVQAVHRLDQLPQLKRNILDILILEQN